jgi:hypothetical protein
MSKTKGEKKHLLLIQLHTRDIPTTTRTVDTPTNRCRSQHRVNSSSSLKKQATNESQNTVKLFANFDFCI